MSYEIIEKLKKEIANYQDDPRWEEIGKVGEVGDGIVRITGLTGAKSQELLTIQTEQGPRRALALNLEEDAIGALVVDDYTHIKVGDEVKGTGQILSLEVGDAMKGRVIDPLGNPLDNQGSLFQENDSRERRFLE